MKHYSASRDDGRFMSLRIEWRDASQSLPEHTCLLIALPGVGNVGKAAVDALNEVNDAQPIARLHHTALPPLATLDDDGLLSPPHYALAAIKSVTGKTILTLTGTSQPVDPNSQGQMAHQILEFFSEQNCNEVIVLAGLADKPERKESFIIASNAEHRLSLEGRGIDVRRDEPRSGAIGMSALLAANGPLHDLSSCMAIATTIGASGDSLASQRLLEAIDGWFDLGMALPADAREKLSKKLEAIAPSKTKDVVRELTESDGFYV